MVEDGVSRSGLVASRQGRAERGTVREGRRREAVVILSHSSRIGRRSRVRISHTRVKR